MLKVWTSQQPLHFGECDAKMFPFGTDVLIPGEASVQV
jgi:hypothetical protein